MKDQQVDFKNNEDWKAKDNTHIIREKDKDKANKYQINEKIENKAQEKTLLNHNIYSPKVDEFKKNVNNFSPRSENYLNLRNKNNLNKDLLENTSSPNVANEFEAKSQYHHQR